MHTVEFIPADWLERSAWTAFIGGTLVCYSKPIQVERRINTRRVADVELLLRSLLLPKAA